MVKMVNGSRYYRALESVSIASALSTTLTIYPCQIRVNADSLNSNFLQLGRSGGRPQRTVHPMRLLIINQSGRLLSRWLPSCIPEHSKMIVRSRCTTAAQPVSTDPSEQDQWSPGAGSQQSDHKPQL